MQIKKYDLWKKEEYDYKGAIDFIPNITSYIHEDSLIRKGMLILPGGGYRFVSPSEAENVARKFYNLGYNTFVLSYTTNFLNIPLKLQPLKDVVRALSMIRYMKDEFKIDENKLIVLGFSAGGHLAASLGVYYDNDLIDNAKYKNTSSKPNALVLSYPVISSGKYAHKESFQKLFGDKPNQEELDLFSLENHVTKNTPPTYVWHTIEDTSVPYINSLLFANSLYDNNVEHILKLYKKGIHGLSLANRRWASGIHMAYYTEEQKINYIKYAIDNNKELPEELEHYRNNYPKQDIWDYHISLNKNNPNVREENVEVSKWPIDVHNWLEDILV